MGMMMGRRLLLSLVLLMAAASGAAAFGIRGVPADYCYRYNIPAAPFYLGTAAAIHLGNTNSCIAGYDLDPRNSYYQFCIPSWVAATDNGTILSGEAAMDHAALSPRTAISAFMRLLDQRIIDDVAKRAAELAPYTIIDRRGRISIQVEAGRLKEEFPPARLAGILISELKRRAEAHLGHEVGHAVIAVPRHLSIQRHDLAYVGRYLGFRGFKFIDEQIATAAAYHLHTERGDGKAILVFHLGGRTCDATIFKFINGTTRLVDARSDLFLGGEDFTWRIVEYMAWLIKQRHGWDIGQDKEALLRLRVACEHAKKALSDQEETQVQVDSLVDGVSFSASLTRAKFEELNRDLFDRAMALVDQVVMGRGGGPREESRKDLVDEIVLVGGSARIPKVRQLVRDYFHGREPNSRKGVEPEEAVHRGTAILSRPEAAPIIEECFEHNLGGY
ncbi:unnamed protein product [Urochloa decumbens]|uniref:Uncharacterized protein n=1 Tax=Urochloa decumbens TaxID=240449 RepID=A0ABC9GKH4_9POAL